MKTVQKRQCGFKKLGFGVLVTGLWLLTVMFSGCRREQSSPPPAESAVSAKKEVTTAASRRSPDFKTSREIPILPADASDEVDLDGVTSEENPRSGQPAWAKKKPAGTETSVSVRGTTSGGSIPASAVAGTEKITATTTSQSTVSETKTTTAGKTEGMSGWQPWR